MNLCWMKIVNPNQEFDSLRKSDFPSEPNPRFGLTTSQTWREMASGGASGEMLASLQGETPTVRKKEKKSNKIRLDAPAREEGNAEVPHDATI